MRREKGPFFLEFKHQCNSIPVLRYLNCTEIPMHSLNQREIVLFIQHLSVCEGCTAPMPVSGGCPALEAITGAALAPMAVAGGVSILAYRER